MAEYRLTNQGPQVQTAIDKSLALGPASPVNAGTMSAADKTKLDNLNPANYQPILIPGQTIKNINGQSILGAGNITINTSPFTVDTTLSTSSTNPVENRVVTLALNGKQAVIPDLATIRENAMRNVNSYVLPSTGIPFSDLSSAVQTALGKAQTALQVETDPTVPAWAKASQKPSYSLSELTEDSSHRLVTDSEKATWNAKQAALVSGTNIKTINNLSILGEGNLIIDVADVVKFTEQTLSVAQQSQARQNIGAASIADIDSNDYVVVTTLPTADATTLGHTYLVGPDANNYYDRYVTQESGGSYTWIPLGSTQMDLSGYATIEYVDDKFVFLPESDFEALAVLEEGKIYGTYEDEI